MGTRRQRRRGEGFRPTGRLPAVGILGGRIRDKRWFAGDLSLGNRHSGAVCRLHETCSVGVPGESEAALSTQPAPSWPRSTSEGGLSSCVCALGLREGGLGLRANWGWTARVGLGLGRARAELGLLGRRAGCCLPLNPDLRSGLESHRGWALLSHKEGPSPSSALVRLCGLQVVTSLLWVQVHLPRALGASPETRREGPSLC